MAKRKKTTKHRRTSRRRRISGINGIDVTGMALTVAGGVAAHILTNKLSSTTGTLSKVAPYSALIAGVALPLLVKNNAMVNALSIGLVAGGGVAALGPNGLKIISGMESSIAGIGYPAPRPQIPYRAVSGLSNEGLVKGTRSNFSGSRMSQMHTIAGVSGCADGSGGMN